METIGASAQYTDVSYPISFTGARNVYITDTIGGTGNTRTGLDGVVIWSPGDSTNTKFRAVASSTAVGSFNWVSFGA